MYQDIAAEVANEEQTTKRISESLKETWQVFQRAFQGEPADLIDMIGGWFLPAIQALGILLAFYFLAKYASKVFSLPIYRRVDQTLGRFVEKLVYRGTIGAGFVFVLLSFGIESTSFAAMLAAAGFAIGLAFQGTLSNFASGILLLVFRPFKVGDLVVAGGVTAKVHEIDLFTTVVDTPDNRRLIMPNSAVAGGTIENVTYHPYRRIDSPILIAHSEDIDATRATFWKAIEALKPVIYEDKDRQSVVHITAITVTAVEWMVRVWAPTSEFLAARDQVLTTLKKQLDRDGIRLAVPRLGVSMSETAHPLDRSFERGTEGERLMTDRIQPRRAEI